MDEHAAADMDGGWKQLIEEYLEEFFRFFFPAVHAGIDFREGYEYLDKELAQIVAGSQSGRREVDKLIQVHWNDGGPEWILLHVEVQAQREADFAERMCVYNCRIWDRYNRPVVSLALLADGNPQFRPNRFHRQKAGCRLEFERNDVLKLFRFMDFLLRLPEDLSVRFRSELDLIEGRLHMPYVTSVERLARQEGILQGVADLLCQTLEVRFGEVPAALLEKIQQCQDVGVLRAFHKQVLTARSLHELHF